MKKIYVTVATLAIAMTGFFNPAFAEYPEKPVTFIVPWPPGDLEDILTRMIAEDFQEEYGVAAAVVNKPGGGGGPFPGAIEVANAPADGYRFICDWCTSPWTSNRYRGVSPSKI